MSRALAPNASQPVEISDATASRIRRGCGLSETKAVEEILEHPEYKLVVSTLTASEGIRKTSRGAGPGRPTMWTVDLILAIVVIALVLNLDLRAARVRMFSTPRLRERFGLPTLTAAQEAVLATPSRGELKLPGIPTENTIRNRLKSWQQTAHLLDVVERAALRVAGRAIHDHNLDCGWIGTDGTRALATNDNDEGTEWWGHDNERPFRQRHIHPVVLTCAPFVLSLLVTPPESELEVMIDKGLPKLVRHSAW